MYNQKFINVLLKILGWTTAVGAVLFLVGGVLATTERFGSVFGKVEFFVGSEMTGLITITSKT